jgi:hypothetical protein
VPGEIVPVKVVPDPANARGAPLLAPTILTVVPVTDPVLPPIVVIPLKGPPPNITQLADPPDNETNP